MQAASTPDISGLTGRFVVVQVIAAGLLVVVVLLILISMRLVAVKKAKKAADGVSPRSRTGDVPKELVFTDRTRWRLLVGLDNRVSTSHTVALLWTLVISYCLLTLTFIALAPHSAVMPIPAGRIPVGWIDAAFTQLDAAYLVALGSPFAAAIAARVIVGSQVDSGKLQKSTASNASILDLVTSDGGDLDLVDFQYTLFNVIAIVFVVSQFATHPARGIPALPVALASLSGISAAVYATNKAAGSNSPRLETLLTPTVAAGGRVKVAGSNLVVDPAHVDLAVDAKDTVISLSHETLPAPDSVPADTVDEGQVTFKVPPTTPPGPDWTIAIRTNANGRAVIYRGLTITEGDPTEATTGTATDVSRTTSIGVPSTY